MTQLRLAPVEESEIPARTVEALGPYRDAAGEIYGVWRTLAHHPDALRRFLVFGNHVLGKNTLPLRTRELVILRVAWLTQAEYEWSQHVAIARRAGVSEAELDQVRAADPSSLAVPEAVALRAADQMLRGAAVDDETWSAVRSAYTDEQLVDLVYTVGQYLTIALAINVFGVQLEAAAPPFPAATETSAHPLRGTR